MEKNNRVEVCEQTKKGGWQADLEEATSRGGAGSAQVAGLAQTGPAPPTPRHSPPPQPWPLPQPWPEPRRQPETCFCPRSGLIFFHLSL